MNLLGPKKWWWLGFSAFLALLGGIALLVWNLHIGLDFTGGTLLEITSSQKIDREAIVRDLEGIGLERIIAQPVGESGLLIKSGSIDQEKHDKVISYLKEKQLTERRFENVGPTVGRDLTQKAIQAVIFASIAIVLYIAYSFRNVPKPASSWRFGLTAVVALIHDVFITVGIFAMLGHFFGYEVDALFITALLTIMGFSVHDTIVVFDRLRETMQHNRVDTPQQFEQVANDSLIQTLNRSINTSVTVILVLLALALLGGETIRPFVITLLIGITIGTYSSIATATPLLIVWQQFVMRRAQSAR